MTGHTTAWQLPYPEPADYVSDSQATMQQLAEKIDAALSQVTASDTYTIPGVLVETFTTSGTFTPPPGVDVVHVAVIGGGGNGGANAGGDFGGGLGCGAGGSGGGVRVYRNVSVSGPVAVTVGGPSTPSQFGQLTALSGASGDYNAPGPSPNLGASFGGRWRTAGQAGPLINGTRYAGGGGGGAIHPNLGGTGSPGAGGAGGGGAGGYWHATAGQAGTGGGGGGQGALYDASPGGGGSGRVMVWTEQPYRRSKIATPDTDPRIVAALDDHGVMVGAYAVDPAAPVVDGVTATVPYPDDPQPTGRMLTVPVDPQAPDGPTHDVPVLAWPVAGWTYTAGIWTPPTEEAP